MPISAFHLCFAKVIAPPQTPIPALYIQTDPCPGEIPLGLSTTSSSVFPAAVWEKHSTHSRKIKKLYFYATESIKSSRFKLLDVTVSGPAGPAFRSQKREPGSQEIVEKHEASVSRVHYTLEDPKSISVINN